jgi:hypothetical protein
VKQFIRNVRAAKTIADERAVVQKESAAIRASFREESHNSDLRYATRGASDTDDMRLYNNAGETMSRNFYTFSPLVSEHTLDKSNV